MSEKHFDPNQWVPNWLDRCADIGADPLLRDSEIGDSDADVQ